MKHARALCCRPALGLYLLVVVGACGGGTGDTGGAAESTGAESSTSGSFDSTGSDTGLDTSGGTSEEPDFDPIEATIADVLDQVRDGPVSCRTLVMRYRELYEARDPQLLSFVVWNEDALARADALDSIPVDERGSLHCVPISVKDNVDVAGLPTSGGIQAMAGSTPSQHADLIAPLVDAGAVVLGKTNMPDFALDGINTVSSVLGQTVNPYEPTTTVYGSSGGTAAAIAASLGIVGIGSDTFGSLTQPASATGLVTIRSTQGLVSGGGVLPLMSLQDVAGPMTRTVTDTAIALSFIAAGPGAPDYTGVLDPDGLQGLHIGFDPVVLEELAVLGLVPDPEIAPLFDASLQAMQSAGGTTQQVTAMLPLFGDLQAATDAFFGCVPVDFRQSFEAYLGTLGPGAPVTSLADIIDSGEYIPSAEGFITNAADQTDTIETSEICMQYQATRQAAQDAITQFMDAEGLDLFAYPAANQLPFTAGQTPPMGWFGYQILSSPTGLPSLTLPIGLSAADGLPIGLTLLARADREDLLIQAAYALERELSARVPPPLP